MSAAFYEQIWCSKDLATTFYEHDNIYTNILFFSTLFLLL